MKYQSDINEILITYIILEIGFDHLLSFPVK